MSKILLITSSFENISLITASKNKKEGEKTTDDSHYPLGLAYLHSYLEKDNQVKTLFLNNQNFQTCFDKTIKAIDNFRPDIIGFQIITANRISTYSLIEFIHKNYPEIKQLIGGIHTTLMHEQLLKKFPFLIAVLGEGEITFSELAKKLASTNPDLKKIDGIAYIFNETVVRTNPRKLIEDLDKLPFPKHELFFHQKRTCGNILTARGCPFNCSFCCLDQLSQRRVRKRSVANVIAEIELMQKKFPQMKTIWIHDDTFFIDNQRVINFCNEIIKRKINLNFVCSGRVKPISEEMVKKLEAANFNKILLGLESGDENILKTCHKNINQKEIETAFKLFAKTNIHVHAFLIVGLPGENNTSIKNTFNFVKKLQKIKYSYYNEDIAILTVYPGTEIYEIYKNSGKISDDYWLSDAPTPLFSLYYSKEQLIAFKEEMLNHISLDRLFTLKGFKAQFFMLPFIIKYTFHNKNILKILAIRLFKSALGPSIYYILKNKIFNKILYYYKKLKVI